MNAGLVDDETLQHGPAGSGDSSERLAGGGSGSQPTSQPGSGSGSRSVSQPQLGAEVLLYDDDARVRDGFRKLLGTAGLVVTATEDADHALRMAGEKYFAVAVIDVDTPETSAGLELMEQLKQRSSSTAVILLASRQTFDVAIEGFRRGAADVVAKSPENVRYLIDAVVEQCQRSKRSTERDRLLAETMEIHEEFLKRLMEATRKTAEVEERAGGTSMAVELKECVVLVVDDDPNTASGLERALGSGYRVVSVHTGGEALDFVGQRAFQLALVKDGLPDLPSKMVAKSLRAESGDGIVLMFSHPAGDKPGRADIIEATQEIALVEELTSGAQLVEQIRELREAFIAKSRERRYLQIFRRDQYDFLRRYVDLRQRLAAFVPPPTESR